MTYDEFAQAVRNAEPDAPQEMIDEVWNMTDKDRSKRVTRDEFYSLFPGHGESGAAGGDGP
jgi:hypothetical protein